MKNSVCLLCCALLAAGCGEDRSGDEAAETPSIQAERPVEPVEQTCALIFSGSVEAAKTVHITSGVTGSILNGDVHAGDLVTSGSLLFEIGGAEAQMTEDAAQNAREERIRLRKELKHMEALVRRGEVTMDQFEEVESSYRLANEACDAAETKLEEYIIRVPWSGKVSKVWVTEGARVVPKTSLVDLYDPSSLVVRLSVPEHQISLIRTGMDVPVELDGFPGQIFYAKVSCIHPEINRTRRRATVDVVLYDNVDLLLGMNAKVKIPFAD